jgi:hypothetical protein
VCPGQNIVLTLLPRRVQKLFNLLEVAVELLITASFAVPWHRYFLMTESRCAQAGSGSG